MFHALSRRWHYATHCKSWASSNRQCATNPISWFDCGWCRALRDRANFWIDFFSGSSHCCRENRVISTCAAIAQTPRGYRTQSRLRCAIVLAVDWPDCRPTSPLPMLKYCDCLVRAMSICSESTGEINKLVHRSRNNGRNYARTHENDMDCVRRVCVCFVFTHFDRLRKCCQSWIVYLELLQRFIHSPKYMLFDVFERCVANDDLVCLNITKYRTEQNRWNT